MLLGLLNIGTKRNISSPTPQTSKILINRLGKSVMGSLNVWNFNCQVTLFSKLEKVFAAHTACWLF